MFSALRHNALFAVCPGHSPLSPVSLCGHWLAWAVSVSLCPQTLGACAPALCPRPLPAKYPAIHFDINQNISEPFMLAVPPPRDSWLFSPLSLSRYLSAPPPMARWRQIPGRSTGALVTRSPAITSSNKILRDAGQQRLNWPQAPRLRGLAPVTQQVQRLSVLISLRGLSRQEPLKHKQDQPQNSWETITKECHL